MIKENKIIVIFSCNFHFFVIYKTLKIYVHRCVSIVTNEYEYDLLSCNIYVFIEIMYSIAIIYYNFFLCIQLVLIIIHIILKATFDTFPSFLTSIIFSMKFSNKTTEDSVSDVLKIALGTFLLSIFLIIHSGNGQFFNSTRNKKLQLYYSYIKL